MAESFGSKKYVFNEICGSNVELSNGNKTACLKKPERDNVVFIQPPLHPEEAIEVTLDTEGPIYALGVTTTRPEEFAEFPKKYEEIPDSWRISVEDTGTPLIHGNKGTFKQGDRVGLQIGEHQKLFLLKNGERIYTFDEDLPQQDVFAYISLFMHAKLVTGHVQVSISSEIEKKIDIGKISYYESKLLGEGSCGTKVYEGTYGNKKVAVKKVPLKGVPKTSREETILMKLMMEHENVIQVYGKEKDGHNLYLALTLCKTDLYKAFDDPVMKESIKLDLITILEQVTKGIEYIHKNEVKQPIAHRDIKPQNILIHEDEETGEQKAMVGDFGLSKTARSGEFSVSQCGTLGWKAPELMKMEDMKKEKKGLKCTATVAVDIFSLGLLYHYSVADGNAHPFGRHRLREINIEEDRKNLRVDDEKYPGVGSLIESMLSPRPEDRPTAEEILSHDIFKDPKYREYFLNSTPEKQASGSGQISGHSSAMTVSHHSDTDLVFYRSKREITGEDWKTKISNRLRSRGIKPEDGIIILSGTHGPITALTDSASTLGKNGGISGQQMMEEDKRHIQDLKNQFKEYNKWELIDVANYNKEHQKLSREILRFNYKHVVFACCYSNYDRCDLKLLFLQRPKRKSSHPEKENVKFLKKS